MSDGKGKKWFKKLVGGVLPIASIFTGGMPGIAGGVVKVIQGMRQGRSMDETIKADDFEERFAERLETHLSDNGLAVDFREALRDENLAMIDLNKIDAVSESWIQKLWRPCYGWLGAFSCFWAMAGYSMYTTIHPDITPIAPDAFLVAQISLGMLGIREFKHYHKDRIPKGVSGNPD